MDADRWMLPAGVEELLPEQARNVEALRRQLLDLYASWGYQFVIPPLIEFTESLLVGLGKDIDLLTFRVTDQLSGRTLGLRADITPQAARIDAHSLREEGVVRLCYAGSVLHTKPKAPLASRSPIQLGAELYGDSGTAGDLEIISLMLQTLHTAGLSNITLDLGHVGIYRAVVSHCELPAGFEASFLDALQRKAATELHTLIDGVDLTPSKKVLLKGLSQLQGDSAVLAEGRRLFAELPEALEAIAELEYLQEQVSKRMPSVRFYFDLAELEGYHYHTGAVFSALVPECGQALAAGGRYDDIGAAFGRSRPATGFSIDLKALLGLMPAVEAADAILAPASDDPELWQQIQSLRAQGETVVSALSANPNELSVPCTRKLSNQDGQWVVTALKG